MRNLFRNTGYLHCECSKFCNKGTRIVTITSTTDNTHQTSITTYPTIGVFELVHRGASPLITNEKKILSRTTRFVTCSWVPSPPSPCTCHPRRPRTQDSPNHFVARASAWSGSPDCSSPRRSGCPRVHPRC